MKPSHPLSLAAALALVLACLPAPLAGQSVGGRNEVFAGSELENYLRYLQLSGGVPLYPWGVRGFTPAQLDTLVPRWAGHPWAPRYDLHHDERHGLVFDLIRPSVSIVENTGFPYGANDGPIWAGRGVTTALQLGFSARYGPLSLTVAPIFFDAENAPFPLMSNGQAGRLAFADRQLPLKTDRPQRFGATPYWRLDPGQSTLRLDAAGLSAGISTANQVWGPSVWNPLIMSNNAAGIPRVFLGTSRPRDIWLARIHGQVVYGDVRQTAWSSVAGDTARRFGTGLVISALPRGIPGLEVGFARFFHMPWPKGGLTWRNFAWPLQAFFKINLPATDTLRFTRDPHQSADNQVAAAFARWVLPNSGFEIYGEFGHEDHNWSAYDFWLEPDHSAAYTLGFGKTWQRPGGGFLALRGEVMNAEPNNLDHARNQQVWYTHEFTRQGHTDLGQVLGSANAPGGAASELSLESYNSSGRWSVIWTRALVQMEGLYPKTGVVNPKGLDVAQSLGVERLFFLGAADLTAGLTFTYEFNRYFGSDAVNLNAHVGVAYALQRNVAGPRADTTVAPPPAAPDTTPLPSWLVDTASAQVWRLTTLGGSDDDRLRLAQLGGVAPADGYLLRTPSSRWGALPGDSTRPRWAWVGPEAYSIYNSTLPYSLNDGALWAGRGVSGDITGGLRMEWGPVSLTLAPQLLYSQNRAFTLPDTTVSLPIPAGRSPFSSPYHIRPWSADLPIRFGDAPLKKLDPGQSSLAVRVGAVETGLSTANEWWGPGIRNAIVLSNQAAGIPRLFVRTTRPLHTGLGSFEASWFVGGLSESSFFDTTGANGLRSISALALTWRPPGESGFTLGLSRAVYGPVGDWGKVPLRLFDVLSGAGQPSHPAPSDSSQLPGRDQIFSLFGRWVFPREHFETWFEWARTELPASLRDLLTAPDQSQGYTLGLQWAARVRSGRGVVRMQTEVTYVERSPLYHDRPVATWYTSRSVIEGYTQQGQVVGAGIGPGASSQWFAVDYLAPRWSVGGFLNRIRWEDDALYEVRKNVLPYFNLHCSHDVTLAAGIRGGARSGWGEVSGAVTVAKRLNAFFRNDTYCDEGQVASKVYSPGNLTLEVRYSPR